MKVLIVGGGITGLTLAYTLEKHSDFEITILEGSNRTGGKIETACPRLVDFPDLIVEQGPDSVFARKPWALDLARELGLNDQIITPKQHEFSMLKAGKLHRMPAGLTLTYSRPAAVDEVSFLSAEGKDRAKIEDQIPRGTGADESIASFFRRRFGDEFAQWVVEPLMAGTHGGLPEQLGMKALYGAYLEREQAVGSLTGGTDAPSAPGSATFVSFATGMEALPLAVGASLKRTRIKMPEKAQSVLRNGQGWEVRAESGQGYQADVVVLAVPSCSAAALVRSESEELHDLLGSVDHASAAVVTLIYDAVCFKSPLEGTGFLVPFTESYPVTGGTWTSTKWPNRAPDELVLVRLFLGRTGQLDVKTETDEQLIERAQVAFEQLTQLSGSYPRFKQINRWHDALPIYEVGHVEKVDRIEASAEARGGLLVTGTSYRGVGIPDCVRQAQETARKIIETQRQAS